MGIECFSYTIMPTYQPGPSNKKLINMKEFCNSQSKPIIILSFHLPEEFSGTELTSYLPDIYQSSLLLMIIQGLMVTR